MKYILLIFKHSSESDRKFIQQITVMQKCFGLPGIGVNPPIIRRRN